MPDDLPAILGGRPVRPEGPPRWPPDDPAIDRAVARAVAERTFGRYDSPHCRELTARLAERFGREHVLLCSSGTAAVELALRGLKVGPGDDVVLAAYDFIGNSRSVIAVGARPLLVDVDPESGQIDPSHLEAAMGARTKAVVVSHLHGGVVPMREVTQIARRRGIPVVEDACQAPGALIDGRTAGTWGEVGVVSFGGSKLLSAGRGGALFTADAQIVQRIRLHALPECAAYPLSDLQAAVLLPQLDRLDERNRVRAKNVRRLCELLETCAGLRPFSANCQLSTVNYQRTTDDGRRTTDQSSIVNQRSTIETDPGYFKLGFWYDPAAFAGLSRDRFVEAMQAEGIAFAAGFRALHLIHSRRRFSSLGDLPVASQADERLVTLHHPILLGDEHDLRQIVRAVDKVRRFATILVSSE